MLRNYLKISIAVLLRRKFLTFVNLFGAMVTLTVLVVAFAIFSSFLSPAGAQHRQNHILTVSRVIFTSDPSRGPAMATITSGPGMAFYEHYVEPLETPDKISYTTGPEETTAYVDGRKFTYKLRRTDAAYWDVLDFEILDGRRLSADDVDKGRFVAVINRATADAYFPDGHAVGQKIMAGNESFEVVGVVANEPETSKLAYSDIWVPLTTDSSARDAWFGNGQAILYVDDTSKRKLVQDEYRAMLKDFEYTPNPTLFDTAYSAASTALDEIAMAAMAPMYRDTWDESRFNLSLQFVGAALVVALLFMLLPAINMANLNIGRMLERAPEIGLRKSAGASRRALVGQFIFENVVLCALGGILAFATAPLVLRVLNRSVFTYGHLGLNVFVFAAGLVLVLVFGVLSGAYPAWKMARLEPAAALRGTLYA